MFRVGLRWDDGIAVVGVIWDHGMRAQAIEVWGFMQFWQEGGSYPIKPKFRTSNAKETLEALTLTSPKKLNQPSPHPFQQLVRSYSAQSLNLNPRPEILTVWLLQPHSNSQQVLRDSHKRAVDRCGGRRFE